MRSAAETGLLPSFVLLRGPSWMKMSGHSEPVGDQRPDLPQSSWVLKAEGGTGTIIDATRRDR